MHRTSSNLGAHNEGLRAMNDGSTNKHGSRLHHLSSPDSPIEAEAQGIGHHTNPNSASNGDLSTGSFLSNNTGLSGYSTSSSQSKENRGYHHPSYSSASITSSIHSGNNSHSSSTGLKRTSSRSVFSDAEMGHAQSQKLSLTNYFGHDINKYTNGSPDAPVFDSALRNFIEPHINKARKTRDERRRVILAKMGVQAHTIDGISIASNAFVPYPALRNERPFLFDVETHPLHRILADTIGVQDLSRLHEHPVKKKKDLLRPLLDERKRRAFHECYDNFVQTFCIPLVHSIAITKKMMSDITIDTNSDNICYRYQAFPCIRVIRPGEFSIGPHCDMSYGHSMGNINFHIPLTPTYGTNCVFTESHPGKEDWHPLKTKSVGLGYVFDGARCLHFTLENTTQSTRVSLDFRIAIYRDRKNGMGGLPRSMSNASMMMRHTILANRKHSEDDEEDRDLRDGLCCQKMLQDNYSETPGYYDEAFIDVGINTMNYAGPVVHKRNYKLLQPDKRVGFPFS